MSKRIRLISIGCDYNSTKFQLNGCINDAIDIGETFVGNNEGYTIDLSLMLDNGVGAYPSKSNIIYALKNAIASCNNGSYSQFIFLFCWSWFSKKRYDR